jgi:hypothetical protein
MFKILIFVLFTIANSIFLRNEYSNITSFTTKSSLNCTSTFNCNYNGICGENNKCYCNDGYITFNSNTSCNYKQKSTIIAFLLEFFFGFESGAGYFYLGLNALGIAQLVYFWGGVCIFINFLSKTTDIENSLLISFIFLWLIGVFIWWLYAIIIISSGQINDSNGAPIQSL